MPHRRRYNAGFQIAAALVILCSGAGAAAYLSHSAHAPALAAQRRAAALTPFQRKVVDNLRHQTASFIVYHDGYYQGGEPPAHLGVCTDVVIRSYGAAGIDLKKLVASDIDAHRGVYGIARPDSNIDQRRCRNLARFFSRNAITLPATGSKADWEPGDVVFWDTAASGPTGRTPDHVGVVTDDLDDQGVPTVVHHWPGRLVSEMDWLYKLPVVYHFRWPAAKTTS